MFLIFIGECFYADRPGESLLATKSDKDQALSFAERVLNGEVNEINSDFGMNIDWVDVIDGNSGDSVGFFGDAPNGSSMMKGKFNHNDYRLSGKDGEAICVE